MIAKPTSRKREAARTAARMKGEEAVRLMNAGEVPHPPVAMVGYLPFSLGYITKARILYFMMGTAAAMFVAADVIAEFDNDPNTRTATSYVKAFRKRTWLAAILVILGPLWLLFHFNVDGFPL